MAAVGLAVQAADPAWGAVKAQFDVEVLGPRTGLLAVQLGELAVAGLRFLIDAGPDQTVELRAGLAAALGQMSGGVRWSV